MTDIGIAVLPSFPDELLATPLDSVTTLSTLYGTRVNNIRIAAQLPPIGRMEPLLWGTEETAELGEIEGRLVKILEQAKAEAGSLGNDLVLVLFSASGDLRILAEFYPRISAFFSWWTDLQAIVSKIDQDQLSNCMLSLRDTLQHLELQSIAQGGSSDKTVPIHNSGNDAARTLVVLAGIVNKYHAGDKFSVRPSGRQLPTAGTKHWKFRPEPREMYPFVAKISVFPENGTTSSTVNRNFNPIPKEYRHPANLYEVFGRYKPTAVARTEHCRTSVRGGVWVCLPTREMLEQFLSDHQGKESRDGLLWVTDVCFSDASSAPMSKEDFRAHAQALKHKDKENKDRKDELDGIGEFMTEMLSLDEDQI